MLGSVYVVADAEGRHKIGFSSNVRRRLKQLARDFGRELTLAYQTESLGWAERVETTAHRALEDRHVGREWFEVTAQEAIAAVEAAVQRVAAGHSPGIRLVLGHNPVRFPEKVILPVTPRMRDEIRSVLRSDEPRTEFIRAAVERELERREAALTARSRTPSPKP